MLCLFSAVLLRDNNVVALPIEEEIEVLSASPSIESRCSRYIVLIGD